MISSQVIRELNTVRRLLDYLPQAPRTEHGWTVNEEQRFWEALDLYPQGPWTAIAEYVGTRSTRQAMTRGQKLRQKLMRWRDRLQTLPITSQVLEELSRDDRYAIPPFRPPTSTLATTPHQPQCLMPIQPTTSVQDGNSCNDKIASGEYNHTSTLDFNQCCVPTSPDGPNDLFYPAIDMTIEMTELDIPLDTMRASELQDLLRVFL